MTSGTLHARHVGDSIMNCFVGRWDRRQFDRGTAADVADVTFVGDEGVVDLADVAGVGYLTVTLLHSGPPVTAGESRAVWSVVRVHRVAGVVVYRLV